MPAEEITALRGEHKEIIHRLAMVERHVNAPRFNERMFRESVATLGVKLREHFRREERDVYGPLNSRLKGDSPTSDLIEDHSSIRKAFDKLSKADLAKRTGRHPPAQLKRELSSLELTLRRHLVKEETVVFWLAECQL